jgi:hypothetical protein
LLSFSARSRRTLPECGEIVLRNALDNGWWVQCASRRFAPHVT